MTRNYESKWWAYIYDQYWVDERRGAFERDFAFYPLQLAGVQGPVLECACGTGAVMLPLMAMGFDLHGFDVSEPMLAELRRKALAEGITDIDARISQQQFADFHYEMRFDAIIIPSNSFMMISSQTEQIQVLRNIHTHLAPNGRLLLHFFVPQYALPAFLAPDWRSTGWAPTSEPMHVGTYTHPESDNEIRLSFNMWADPLTQRESGSYYFEHDDAVHEIPYESRYTYPAEFELLLRHAGFDRWEGYGAADCSRPIELSAQNSMCFWLAHKDG
jgi:SAM-dependent methyltransferase